MKVLSSRAVVVLVVWAFPLSWWLLPTAWTGRYPRLLPEPDLWAVVAWLSTLGLLSVWTLVVAIQDYCGEHHR